MDEYDPLYVAARSVLLDALEALGAQSEAMILVGAQAIYMRTGDADIAIAPYTTDADLVLAPDDLADEPHLEDLMREGDFSLDARQPGSWVKTVLVGSRSVIVPVDIMVPELLASSGGRRSVRIAPHDKMAARSGGAGGFLAGLRPLLLDQRAEGPSSAAVRLLAVLFGARRSEGVQMAVRSLRASVPAERVEAITTSFARQVRDRLRLE